jgi:iron complex outermembrane receptor protein
VFFGNLSETRTPTLGYVSADGTRPTDPWVARQYEGGFRLRPLEKLWFSASYYHIDQENMPQLDDSNGNYYFDGRNSSDGVELSLSGDLTENWTVMAMYAYNFYVNHDATGKASEFERVPRNTISFNTSYRLHGWDLVEGIVVGMGYRFRSMSYATMRGSYVDENLRFDPSHVFDVNMSVPFAKFLQSSESDWADKWFLTFAVRNIFDERYFDTSRHYYECFVGEPRTFEIGIRGGF